MNPADPGPWLLLVTAAHLGFQLTVGLVVYPALRDALLSPSPDDGDRVHAAHTRRIGPVVAVLYLLLVLVVGWTLLVHADDPGAWIVAAGVGLSVGTTAVVAGPLHRRLASAPDPAERSGLLVRLLRADRVRLAGALLAVVGAVLLVAPA